MTSDAPDPRRQTPDPVAPAEWLSPGRFALVLSVLLAVTFWRVLFGGEAFFYRDYGFLGYPFAHFHRECFWSGDFFPLWNPYVNCGAPFLAQWNTLCLYPGALIYLLLPLPWSLGFFCVAHLFLGGMGMRALAERWTGSRFGAAVAGVSFVFSGLVLGCVIYPNYLVALGWMPWVVLATRRAWQEGGRSIVPAALAGAMQMLSGAPEIILLTWGFLAALLVTEVISVQCSVFSGRTNGSPRPEPSEAKTEYWKLNTDYFSVARRFAAVIALITGLCAAQLLPFFQLLSLSQRSGDAVNTFWSLPGWGWVNLFFPLFMNFQTEQGVFVMIGQAFFPSVYLGIVPLTLALLAVWRIGLRRAECVVRTESDGAFVVAVPPHPGPLPPGEGERQPAPGDAAAPSAPGRASSPPLPGGEGRGEGEGRRLESSAPNPAQMHPPQAAAVWEVRLLAGATLLAVLLAMGDNFPLWRWLREVLPLGVMRFPVKALLLAAFTVPLLAAWGVKWLSEVSRDMTSAESARYPADEVPWHWMFSQPGWMDAIRACVAVLILYVAVAAIAIAFPLGQGVPPWTWGIALERVGIAALLVAVIPALCVRPPATITRKDLFLISAAVALESFFLSLNPTIPAAAFQPGLAADYHASKGALTPAPKLGESRIMLSPLAERALHTRMVPKFYDDFIGQRLAFWGNLNLLDGLPKVNGASTLVTREWNDVEYFLYGTTNPAPANLMDFLGVTHTTKPGELMQWERRTNAMPLVSLPAEVEGVYRSPTLPAWLRPDWNPKAKAFLTPELPDNAFVTWAKPQSFSSGSVRVVRFSPTRLDLESEAMEQRFLVVAQNHYPSWQVTVNGETEFVAKANHAFQAIPIPAGKSTIRLDYVDWPFRIGSGISVLTLLGCVVLWRRGSS